MSFNFSCRKEYIHAPVTVDSLSLPQTDAVSKQFFNTHLPGDENVIAIRNNILKQNERKAFIDQFVKFAGYPIWDKAVTKIGIANTSAANKSLKEISNGKVIFIPLALDTQKRINAILQIKIAGNDTAFHVLYKWQYNDNGYSKNNKFNNADQIAALFMGFENYVYGYKNYKLNDSLLFKPEDTSRKSSNIHVESFNQSSTLNRTMLMQLITITTCIDIEVPAHEGQLVGCPPDQPCPETVTETVCSSYSIWVEGGGDGSGNDDPPLTPPGTSGGGSGGSDDGGWQDDPCAPSGGSTSPSTRVGQLAPCDGGGSSGSDPWLPVLEDDYYEFNKSTSDINTGDIDNNTIGGFDETSYTNYELAQTWPTINNVIPISDFIGWGTPGISRNCMSYAKAQIAKKGYSISNYNTSGQTIQIYAQSGGVNVDAVKDAIGYLKSALQRGIPVIVGIDDIDGSSNPQTDNTTDHFVVIVGMGTDTHGNYFSFYDNASGDPSQGTNINNKLYFDSSSWLIKGRSQTSYASSLRDYKVTMIRKSKAK